MAKDKTRKLPRGIVHVIKDRCKECGICIEFCPVKVLAFSKEFNRKGYHYAYPENPEKCIYCRNCELMCPDFAIYVTKAELEDEKKKALDKKNEDNHKEE